MTHSSKFIWLHRRLGNVPILVNACKIISVWDAEKCRVIELERGDYLEVSDSIEQICNVITSIPIGGVYHVRNERSTPTQEDERAAVVTP